MTLSNSPRRYGSVAKTFHWLTVLLIFSVVPVGLIANSLAEQIQNPGFDGVQDIITRATILFSLHKTLGVTIFFVAFARIIWSLTQPKPGLLNADNRMEAWAAETVHWLLYGSLVIVPLTGWIHHAATTGFAPIWWPFGQALPFVAKSDVTATVFAGLHLIFEKVLIVAILLHIAGALKHHVIDKDQTLRRMLPGRNEAPEPPVQSHTILPAVTALGIWAITIAAGASLGSFAGHDHGAQTTGHAQDTSAAHQPHDENAQGDGGHQDTSDPDPDTWVVQSGSLGLEITQLGSKVSGTFDTWTADIRFANPGTEGPAGSVLVDIDISSLSLGTVTNQAMGTDYFDSATYPKASFRAELTKTAQGYSADGSLQIRDKTLPVSLPFSLKITDGVAEMQGALTVNRLDYGVGASVKDESSLAFAVVISVELTAVSAR